MTIDSCEQTRAWDLDAGEELFLSQLYYSSHRIGRVAQFGPDGRYFAQGERYS